MTKKTALGNLALLWLTWVFLMLQLGELSHLDWWECMHRSDGSPPKEPRFGEVGTFGMIMQAARNASERIAGNLWLLVLYVPVVVPAAVAISVSASRRERMLQFLFCAGLLICLWLLLWPVSGHHDCDGKGIGLLIPALAILGLAPGAALAFFARRI